MASAIDALVYIDAIIPENGVSGWDGFPAQRKTEMLAGAQSLGGQRVPPPDPSIWGVKDADDMAWLRACCTPHPLKTMHDRPRLGSAWQSVRVKHYVLAGGQANPRFQAYYDAVKCQPDWTTEVIAGGHDLMVTHPNEVRQALDRVAASIQGTTRGT
jgi:hypothetical protein